MISPHYDLSEKRIWSLLNDPNAVELRDKVGVVGKADGSAKTTTRLLRSEGVVCKTRIDQTFDSLDQAIDFATQQRNRGVGTGVWHPRKVWLVVYASNCWYWMTICPMMSTLRDLSTIQARMSAWTRMLQLGAKVFHQHSLGLDLNPSNFAQVRDLNQLCYLDEEVYTQFHERNVGGAIVARIPEEATDRSMSAVWTEWGKDLADSLNLGKLSWSRLIDEISGYPLPERFTQDREAVLSQLARKSIASGRRIPTRQDRLTCVFSDVHSNYPALNAVLQAATDAGATDYLFLGDAVGYGPHPSECIDRLRGLPNLSAIQGNHDFAISNGQFYQAMNSVARTAAQWTDSILSDSDRQWLSDLPREVSGEGWIAVHGAPRDPTRFFAYVYDLTYEDNLKYLRDREIAFCFHGHSHIQIMYLEGISGYKKLPGPRSVRLDRKHYWLINPGSVGQPRDGDYRAAFLLWNRTTGEIHSRRVDYPIDDTLEALRKANLPIQLSHRLKAGA